MHKSIQKELEERYDRRLDVVVCLGQDKLFH